MAIKVGGTTVVDDSRNLTNIASVDATTVAALSAAGVGDITAVTAGSGLTGGGTSGAVTVNHADTSSQGSVNNSGSTVIQDITLDTYGHITGIASTTIAAGAGSVKAWANFDGRYNSIRSDVNVSSISDYGTGHHGINMSPAVSTSYAGGIVGRRPDHTGRGSYDISKDHVPSSTQFRVYNGVNGGYYPTDGDHVHFTVVR